MDKSLVSSSMIETKCWSFLTDLLKAKRNGRKVLNLGDAQPYIEASVSSWIRGGLCKINQGLLKMFLQCWYEEYFEYVQVWA